MITNAVLLIILSVTLAIAAPFLNRHPLVMAWAKRREEQRILAERKMQAREAHPAARRPAGRCPRVLEHETYLLMPGEEDAFARVAEELGAIQYQWITDAINGAAEADQ